MGHYEAEVSLELRRIAQGDVLRPSKGRAGGGPPNHKALREARNYATGDRASALYLLDRQEQEGLWAWGEQNEFGSTSHCAWWQCALGALWYFAWKRQDAEVLNRVTFLHADLHFISTRCATPGKSPRIAMPGARSHLAVDRGSNEPAADQRNIRDQHYKLLSGGKLAKPAEFWESPDRQGLWFLSQIPAAVRERAIGSSPRSPEQIPMKDPLTVLSWDGGHLAYYDAYHGISPSWYCVADYDRPKSEVYGIEPGTTKGARAGERPMDLPPYPANAKRVVFGGSR